jgi:hypothetical protein
MNKILLRFLVSLLYFAMFVSYSSAQVLFTEHTVDDDFDGPAGVYAADIDGDGDNDVLGAAIDGNEIAWWRNDGGDPIAWTKQTIDSSFAAAAFVHAADVDGDTAMDVLGAAWDDNEIAWWHNEGGDPIVWRKQTIDDNFNQAHEVFAADVDGDGDTDVLGAAAGSSNITWWRNGGGKPIEWTEQQISGFFAGARSVYVADIDGDDDNDVLGAALNSHDILWWRNDGGDPIEWTEMTVDDNFRGAHMVRTADIDEDGDPDVFGAAYTDRDIAWWRNDGGDPVSWAKQTIEGNLVGCVTVYPVDIDVDGDLDVIGAGQDGNDIAWWSNNGGNPIDWERQMINSNFDGAWPAFAIDLNGDDRTDVICGGYDADEIRWWENELPAGFGDQSEPSSVLPRSWKLHQNYPNPFNPSTVIHYELDETEIVVLKIYNVSGRVVRTLVDERQWAGAHRVYWDGRNDIGERMSSGIYLYMLQSGISSQSRKMILLK